MMANRKRRGFTLMETVVTVGIIAAMAAVVYPQVAKQFEAADPARIQNDLKGIQTAIETFSVNVRAVPGDLDDISNPVVSDADISNGALDSTLTSAGLVAAFSAAHEAAWKGPYVDFAFAETAGNDTERARPTGFGGEIQDTFVCYNASTNAGEGTGGNQECTGALPGDRLFLAVRVTGLGTAMDDAFVALNEAFDGQNEGLDAATLGRIRLIGGTTYFLVLPLN